MNKDFIAILVLTVFTSFTINYFFSPAPSNQDKVVQAGAGYALPTVEDLSRPVNRTVTLAESSEHTIEATTTVPRNNGSLIFSTNGGVISQVLLNRYHNSAGEPVQGLHSDVPRAPHDSLFFLALDAETPLTYRKDSEGDVDGGYQVVYSAETDEWEISKTFTVDSDTNKVTMTVGFDPRVSKPTELRPRILLPAPRMEGVAKNLPHAMVSKDGNAGIIETTGKTITEQMWVTPAYFGATDTYLAHMLVKDGDHFARRGFFMAPENGPLSAVLEGPAVTQKSSYTMSFYVGQKEHASLMAVDTQLQDLLFSGWFSFFSKWLLALLLFLFSYLGNFGFAIIAATLLIKLFFMPFMNSAQRGAKMRDKLKRPMAQIQAQYANDPQRAFEEQNKLLAQHGVSQTAMAIGCLVSIMQLPLFFMFYRVLGSSAELYQMPFIGWITDLSVRDPYYLLPILASVFIFNQPMQLPGGGGRSQTMGYILPLVMVGLVFSIPAGVQLYMCVNMGFVMVENWFRPKA